MRVGIAIDVDVLVFTAAAAAVDDRVGVEQPNVVGRCLDVVDVILVARAQFVIHEVPWSLSCHGEDQLDGVLFEVLFDLTAQIGELFKADVSSTTDERCR